MQIQEAEIMEEYSNGLNDSGRSFAEVIAGGLDKLTKGAKAGIVTEALIFADVVKKPEEMRAISDQNKSALNAYFDTLNYEKIVQSNDQIVQGVKTRFVDRLKKNTPLFIAGLATGVIGASIYSAKKKDKK